MKHSNVALLPELSIECTLKAKDLYRIMPPDNKMRRRIVDASTTLGKAAEALVEADSMLKVCRDNPRAEDEERMAVLEASVARVREYHNKEIDEDGDPWCGACGGGPGGMDWPCPTLVALDGLQDE